MFRYPNGQTKSACAKRWAPHRGLFYSNFCRAGLQSETYFGRTVALSRGGILDGGGAALRRRSGHEGSFAIPDGSPAERIIFVVSPIKRIFCLNFTSHQELSADKKSSPPSTAEKLLFLSREPFFSQCET